MICGHALLTKISESIGRNRNKTLVGWILLEAWKFCQPCCASGEQRAIPWTFEHNNSNATAIMDRINVDMADSAIVKNNKKDRDAGPSSSSAGATASTENTKPPKRHRANRKAPAGDAKRKDACAALPDTEPSTWIDDMVFAIEHAQQQAKVTGDLNPDAVAKTTKLAVILALEFAWLGEATLNGKTYRAWTLLRPEIQDIVKQSSSSSGAQDRAYNSARDLGLTIQRETSPLACPILSTLTRNKKKRGPGRITGPHLMAMPSVPLLVPARTLRAWRGSC